MFSKRSLIAAAAAVLIAVPVMAQDAAPRPMPIPPTPPAVPNTPVPPIPPTAAQTYTIRANPKRAVLEKGAFLGVSVSTVPAPLSEQLKLPRGFGLVVQSVVEKGPAEAAGIKQYDVIQKLDDQIMVLPQQLEILVRSHKTDDTLSITLIRQGQPMTVSAKLVEKDLPPLTLSYGGGVGSSDEPPDVPSFVTIPSFSDPNQKPTLTSVNSAKHEMVWVNGDYVMTIRNDTPIGKHLRVTESNRGDALYDGPLDNAVEIQKLPADLQSLIRNGVAFMDAKWQAEASSADAARASAKNTTESALQTKSLAEQAQMMRASADAARASAANPSPAGSHRTGTLAWQNETRLFLITFQDGKATHLLAQDMQGNILFNGPVLSDEDRNKIPTDEIRAQFDKLLQHPEMGKDLKGN